MASGMEMLVESAFKAMIARLTPEQVGQLGALIKSGTELKAQVDRIEANQIAIMRTLGIANSSTLEHHDNGQHAITQHGSPPGFNGKSADAHG